MAPLEASGSLAALLVFVIILRDILTLKHQLLSNTNTQHSYSTVRHLDQISTDIFVSELSSYVYVMENLITNSLVMPYKNSSLINFITDKNYIAVTTSLDVSNYIYGQPSSLFTSDIVISYIEVSYYE